MMSVLIEFVSSIRGIAFIMNALKTERSAYSALIFRISGNYSRKLSATLGAKENSELPPLIEVLLIYNFLTDT